MTTSKKPSRTIFPADQKSLIKSLGKKALLENLRRMLMIRNFEVRAESAYLQGKVGGFFHSYIGQEAIQTAALHAMGPENWWVTTYRCHALALLLGATPDELMAELYGRSTGNAKGRGGSMHFYTERLLGGFGIVGGKSPSQLERPLPSNISRKKAKWPSVSLVTGRWHRERFMSH